MALTAALVLSGLLAGRPPEDPRGEITILMNVSAFGTWGPPGAPRGPSPLETTVFLILPFF